jgi:hypothetical protein
VSAAVDRRPGLHAHEAIAARFLRVLHNFESAHDAETVQVLIVMAQFFDAIALLVDKIARQHELAGPVRIARKRPDFARWAVLRFVMIVIVRHGLSPQFQSQR